MEKKERFLLYTDNNTLLAIFTDKHIAYETLRNLKDFSNYKDKHFEIVDNIYFE